MIALTGRQASAGAHVAAGKASCAASVMRLQAVE